MSKRIVLDLPDSVYECARQTAAEKGQAVEATLVSTLSNFYQAAHNDAEHRALIAAAVEATDWWDSEGDREWDCWQR